MHAIFELALVLMFVVLCLWQVAQPFYWGLQMLADDAAREERRLRRIRADESSGNDAT